MNGQRLTQIPDRTYNFLIEHPGSKLRDVCIGVRGRFRRLDLAYFKNVLGTMEDAGTAYEKDGLWYAVDDIDFTEWYYIRRNSVTREDVTKCLEECGPSTAPEIDEYLAYRTLRGCYPLLMLMVDGGEVIREKNDAGIWVYRLAE